MANETDLDFAIDRNNARMQELEREYKRKQLELEQYVNTLSNDKPMDDILELEAEEVLHQEEQFDDPFDIPIIIDVSYFPDPNGGEGDGQGQGGGSSQQGQGQPQDGEGQGDNQSQQNGNPENGEGEPQQGQDNQSQPTDSGDALRNALSEELDSPGNSEGESDEIGQLGDGYDDNGGNDATDGSVVASHETADAGSEFVTVKKKFRDMLGFGR